MPQSPTLRDWVLIRGEDRSEVSALVRIKDAFTELQALDTSAAWVSILLHFAGEGCSWSQRNEESDSSTDSSCVKSYILESLDEGRGLSLVSSMHFEGEDDDGEEKFESESTENESLDSEGETHLGELEHIEELTSSLKYCGINCK